MTKWIFSSISALLVFVLDRLTKFWVLKNVSSTGLIKINDFINIVFVSNKGGLWGLGRHSHRSGAFFIVASVLAIIVILSLLKRLPERSRLVPVAFGFILGGGLGNLIDRFIYGAVVDFIDLHYKSWHWPAFNIADTFIVLGIVMLILFYRPSEKG